MKLINIHANKQQNAVRVINTDLWINTLCSILDEGREVSLTITGNSMKPFLRPEQDRVILRKPLGNIKKGKILLYKRNNGSFILHRVVKCDKNGIYFCGDGQSVIEGPLPYSCIVAETSSACRNGKIIDDKHFCWWFFANIWLRLCFARKLIFRLYFAFKTKIAI